MSNNNNGVADVVHLMKDGDAIDDAIAEAVREAPREHGLFGNPIAVWRDGRVVWIPPPDIDVED